MSTCECDGNECPGHLYVINSNWVHIRVMRSLSMLLNFHQGTDSPPCTNYVERKQNVMTLPHITKMMLHSTCSMVVVAVSNPKLSEIQIILLAKRYMKS